MNGQQRVKAALERRRPAVDEALAEAIPLVPPEELYGASRHLLDAGGKRLRPTMLLLAAEALGDREDEPIETATYRTFPDIDGEPIDVLSAAVSIEIVQSFTLIHDDIMDDDDMRRGVKAVHRAYDDSMAILAGDTLYARAFELMLGTGAPPTRSVEALATLARTCTDICEGQAIDIAFEKRDEVTVNEYLEMVELKTAVLFSAAVSIPAVLLGYKDAIGPLAEYGRDVGRAFQIQDDLLDLTTPTEKLGKQRGSDLVEGKQTLVTVHARQQGVDVDSLVGADPTEADIDEAVAKLEASGSLEYAQETAHEYVESGIGHLEVLPDNEPHHRLVDIAEFLIEREY